MHSIPMKFNNLYNLYIESIDNNAEFYLNSIRSIISREDQLLDMNTDILKQINNLSNFLIKGNSQILNSISEKLKELNIIDENILNQITTKLRTYYTYDFLKEFDVFLKSPKLNVQPSKYISFIQPFKNTKYESQWKKLFKDLFEIKYKNNGGNGQILFIILFNNCSKPSSGGDVLYGEEDKMEIKTNRGIIANGNSGGFYGNNGEMGPYLIKRLEYFTKHIDPNLFNTYKDNFTLLNFKKTDLNQNTCTIIKLFNEVKQKNNDFSLDSARDILCRTLKKVYLKANKKDMNFLSYINLEDNIFTIDAEKFILKFLQFTIQYYMNVQKFKYLTFMDANNSISFSDQYFIKNEDNYALFLQYISIEEFLSFSQYTKRKVAMSMRINFYK